jgi:hypothetical protein
MIPEHTKRKEKLSLGPAFRLASLFVVTSLSQNSIEHKDHNECFQDITTYFGWQF